MKLGLFSFTVGLVFSMIANATPADCYARAYNSSEIVMGLSTSQATTLCQKNTNFNLVKTCFVQSFQKFDGNKDLTAQFCSGVRNIELQSQCFADAFANNSSFKADLDKDQSTRLCAGVQDLMALKKCFIDSRYSSPYSHVDVENAIELCSQK